MLEEKLQYFQKILGFRGYMSKQEPVCQNEGYGGSGKVLLHCRLLK